MKSTSIPRKVAWHLCFVIFLFLFGQKTLLFGQIQTGQFFLGGNFKLISRHSLVFSDYRSIQFNPELGFVFSPKWAVGLGVPLDYRFEPKFHALTFGFTPFVRRYFFVSPEFYAMLTFQTECEFLYYGDIFDISTYRIRLVPALSYFLTKRFAIEGGFGGAMLEMRTSKNQGDKSSIIMSENRIKLTPFCSLRYYFPLKKFKEQPIASN